MSENRQTSFQIISDGACDIGLETARQHQIEIVPFYVTFDGQQYVKEEKEMKVRDIYQKMKDMPGTFPKTSLPTVMDYVEVFRPYVEKGIPILCICLSAKFTGSYNSAQLAKEELHGQYAHAEIEVIDLRWPRFCREALCWKPRVCAIRGCCFKRRYIFWND